MDKRCRVCAGPATETREEVAKLSGYGEVVRSNSTEHAFCLRHAQEFDARQLAAGLSSGGELPRDSPAARVIGRAINGSDSRQVGLVDTIALPDQPSRDLAMVWEQIIGICYLATQIPTADVRALLDEYGRTDALMPMLDPTGYRKIMGNIPEHREIATAFLNLRKVIDKFEPKP